MSCWILTERALCPQADGVVPLAGDSVSLGSASGSNCDTDVLVLDVVTPQLAAVTVQSISIACFGALRINAGARLNANTVTVNGQLLLMDLTATVSALTSFNLNALGNLQGTGTIDSPASVLRGSVSPGIANGCPNVACKSVFLGADAATGTLDFPGAETTFIGADLYLKYYVRQPARSSSFRCE